MRNVPRIDRFEKNYLINGGMDFWQRSVGPVTVPNVGGGSFITSDRWSLRRQGTWNTNPTSERSTTVPNNKTQYSNSIVGDPSSSTDTLSLFQPMEGAIARDLAGEIVSVSVWVRTESALNLRLVLDIPSALDDYSSSTVAHDVTQSNVLTVGQWTLVKFENLSIPITAVLGLRVALLLSNMSVTGSSVEHNVAQAMLNKGSKAFGFEKAGRTIAEELQLCQRYYEKSYRLQENPGFVTFSGAYRLRAPNTSTTVFSTVGFRVSKRTLAPTITLYSPQTGATGQMDENNSADRPSQIAGSSESAFTARTTAGVSPVGLMSFHWTADAEIS